MVVNGGPAQGLAEAAELLQRGYPQAAEAAARQVLAVRPADGVALQILGHALLVQGRGDEALDPLRRAARKDPASPELLVNLGALELQGGRFDDAARCFKRALRLRPDWPEALSNLGWALARAGRLEEAEERLARALALRPQWAECRDSLRRVVHDRVALLSEQRGPEAALAVAETALARDPGWGEGRYFRACSLLMQGRLAEGWSDFRPAQGMPSPLSRPLPDWDGRPLTEGTLLIRADQGIGDQILGLSILPEVLAVCPRVVVECDPRLIDLLARSFPGAEFVGWVQPHHPRLAGEDLRAQLQVSRLPALFRPDMESFGDGAPFLRPLPDRVAALRAAWSAAAPGRRLVGISWKSDRSLVPNRKNVPLRQWQPVLGRDDVAAVCLQYDTLPEELEAARAAGWTVLDPGFDTRDDLEGLAAGVAACDLVVTISNATAHFAGAVGTPAWVMVHDVALWHWFLARTDSPWYSSIRLFRKDRAEAGWDGVLERLGSALAELPRPGRN